MTRQVPLYTPSTRFNRRSKSLAYVLIAILMAAALALEDIADGDMALGNILLEFLGVTVGCSIAFPLHTKLYNWAGRHFYTRFTWTYSTEVFVIIWILLLPMLYLSAAVALSLPQNAEDIWVVWVSILILAITVVIIEAFWNMLEKRQHLEIANERLLRSHDMAKYQALMNQISPHFLFNSLNVLSYLVYQDPRSAEQFIEELSKIYRYVIQLNETYLVPLKKEVDFIESYFFLQKIRFQNNLTLDASIDAEVLQKFIPPLTLEVLMENAIKHNTIGKETPLHIKITNHNGSLIVENNIQPRDEHEVDSTQVGLKNLKEKFMILDSELPEFKVANGSFIAKIPLLESEP